MNSYNVYFQGLDEPVLVTGLSFSDAEKTALRLEKFHEILKIEKT